MIQDHLTGLWTDSATVISMREDKRSCWVRDKHSRSLIIGRRRLKQPSSTDTSTYSLQTNRVSVIQFINFSAGRTLKVRLHKLPLSVALAAASDSIGINQDTLYPNKYMCIFYVHTRGILPDSTAKHFKIFRGHLQLDSSNPHSSTTSCRSYSFSETPTWT